MLHNAERLLATGHVRGAMTVEQVRDVLYAYLTPDLYAYLVLQAGWTVEQFGDFLYRGMRSQLLDPRP